MSSNVKKIKIKQIVSAIRRPENQSAVLRGLGLKKLNKVRELEDTPSIRGMIEKVKHLVVVLE
jgi:large subunit ribosomal protein L30